MKKGILIYYKEDYEKNQWFANEFVKKAKDFDLEIELRLVEELSFIMDGSRFQVWTKQEILETPSFVINRSREKSIAYHFEAMGVFVFNSGFVSDICNDKARTHQVVNACGIPSVAMMMGNRKSFCIDQVNLSYPLVVKSLDGHGGSEVMKIENRLALEQWFQEATWDHFLLQEMSTKPGVDVRVYMLGEKVLGAVKRSNQEDFKSNISTGGSSEAYTLSEVEYGYLENIRKAIAFDFVGIDFILDKEENFLFNEIEDMVGTRSLYANYDLDVVAEYLAYITEKIHRI